MAVSGRGALRSHDFAGFGNSLEEVSFRRYPRLGDLRVLGLYGVLENFGYRQMATWWRARGVFRFLRGHQDWGTMTRKGFEKA